MNQIWDLWSGTSSAEFDPPADAVSGVDEKERDEAGGARERAVTNEPVSYRFVSPHQYHRTHPYVKEQLATFAPLSSILLPSRSAILPRSARASPSSGSSLPKFFSKDAASADEEMSDEEALSRQTELLKFMSSQPLSDDELGGLLQLHQWVVADKLSCHSADEITVGDLLLTYFSSYSRHNPDAKGCWQRWLLFRNETSDTFKDVNFRKIKQFFDTGVFSMGYDQERRPVWFIRTQFYDPSYGAEVIAKSLLLWLMSLLWDLRNNAFDFVALRKGVSLYVDMSHWSLSLVTWNVVKLCKQAMVAFPFQLIDIYIVNTPTFIYLLRQVGSKVLVPHAMDKLKILNDTNEFYRLYGDRQAAPDWAGGVSAVSGTQWMRDRGYLEDL